MGLLDGLGEQIVKNKGHIDSAIEQGGDFVDSKTDSKYASHVDKGQDFLRDKVGEFGGGKDVPRQEP
ncbi:antitoxin [Tessaracoccus antarcticus]|uniref:Antitoxin n=1 Tax=Tessaracoccus antarcticus TaxID=2479848 RepID=A0A3M0G1W0_9ACTN|nr:antitoxin [Tessaracoccus antarcticus]RMB58924.1 antitoxin [Tessaracoccus antarcticus]